MPSRVPEGGARGHIVPIGGAENKENDPKILSRFVQVSGGDDATYTRSLGTHKNAMFSWLDAPLAALGDGFMRTWSKVERSYRRPFSRAAFRLKFAYYPLLAGLALGWLAWDWTHDRTLNAAENAIFDQVVKWRPFEPQPSGRVVLVEIDECSIEHFRARGEGGWPWSRQRHADLLDRLDREGVAAAGYDVLLTDPSREDPGGDLALEAMAQGGEGRFLFAAARMHPDYDAGAPLTASQAPGAFPLVAAPAIITMNRALAATVMVLLLTALM